MKRWNNGTSTLLIYVVRVDLYGTVEVCMSCHLPISSKTMYGHLNRTASPISNFHWWIRGSTDFRDRCWLEFHASPWLYRQAFPKFQTCGSEHEEAEQTIAHDPHWAPHYHWGFAYPTGRRHGRSQVREGLDIIIEGQEASRDSELSMSYIHPFRSLNLSKTSFLN